MAQIRVHNCNGKRVSVDEKITHNFETTALATREILVKSRDLSGAFAQLSKTYSTDSLAEGQRLGKKAEVDSGVTGLKARVRRATVFRPSSKTRAMFKAYRAAVRAHESFVQVWRAHGVSSAKVAELNTDQAITSIFELRHEANDMRDAEQVIEGRNAYNTMRIASGMPYLMDRIGV